MTDAQYPPRPRLVTLRRSVLLDAARRCNTVIAMALCGRLTPRAVVRRAAGEAHARDRRAAAQARLAGAAVDAELVLVGPPPPGAADVIADARPAPPDRSVEHSDDRLAEPVGLGRRRVAAAL